MILGRRSFRARVTLWYVGLLGLLLIALSFAIYLIVRDTLNESLDEDLERRVTLVQASVVIDDEGPTLANVPRNLGDDADEAFVRVFGSAGQLRDSDTELARRLPVAKDRVEAALAGRSRTYEVDGAGESYRVTATPIRAGTNVVGALEVGISRSDTDEALGTLLVLLLIAVPVTVAVALLGGLLIAGRALRPIIDMTNLARGMSVDALDQRLHYDGPHDELGHLADTFNRMLDRLDAAFQRQTQFTGDAAHELRTPLTAIQGQVDVALQRDRSGDEYRDVLGRIGHQAGRLTQLVRGLLTLARADAGRQALQFELVDLPSVIREVLETARPEATTRDIDLRLATVRDPFPISADRQLIGQLLDNLVRNALTVTPPGGTVEISVAEGPDGVDLSVADTGPGIPEDDRERIFDRFYRVEAARSRRDGGAGLGLAISRWIAEAHGGSIHAQNRPGGGARFTVRLPAGGDPAQ